ncbi:hypothetical protein JCM8097_008997 [Rhodosporidiobolus ruineniae]
MPIASTAALPAASSRASRRHAPYLPPPRQSSLAPDPALATLGAVYIGWGDQRDPAPLCCPVATKSSLVKRYGEAAVGWMTAPAPPARETTPQPAPRPATRPPSLYGVPLPPLPPLPALPATASTTPIPDLAVPQHTPSHPTPTFAFSSPTFLSTTTSTPPASITVDPIPRQISASPSASSSSLYFEDALRSSSFDDTTTLSLSLSLPAAKDASLSSLSSLLDLSSRPPSPVLASASSKPFSRPGDLEVIPEIKAEEDDDGFASESLWSAGEDGGLMYHGTDVESEASWAAW